jgi:hypothetical protein
VLHWCPNCRSGLIVLLQLCYSDGTAVSEWRPQLCHSDLIVVLQWCYSDVKMMSLWCHSDVTVVSAVVSAVVSHLCHNGVRVVLQWCYSGAKGKPLCSRSAVGASHPGSCHPSFTKVLYKSYTKSIAILHKRYTSLTQVL